ncbi:MAG: hypothetical protein GTN74_05400 [Proteobacteria bacterium]|nr:hypothetical protein [Pseudomonadota bacterium]NIS68927.1 hypothetical protein [Pseudomonadota bacterium]
MGALFNPLDGGTNPFQLMVALSRKAIQLSAEVFSTLAFNEADSLEAVAKAIGVEVTRTRLLMW